MEIKGQEQIHLAAQIIRRGGIVAFPTETVYGLGADAFNPVAVARIFEVKQRPRFDPLIVHVADRKELDRLVIKIPSRARRLMDRFWPGPLTVVLQKKAEVPEIVTAGLSTVAVRMPKHPMALDLIRTAGCPIAAPSANPFGYVSPTTAQHVAEQLENQVDYILDGGPCEVGLESTIVSFAEGEPLLLRPGGVPLEEIESVIGTVQIGPTRNTRPLAPGMLPRHYAPRTPILLEWTEADVVRYDPRKTGLLAFDRIRPSLQVGKIELLSERGDLREAAANLFSAIRRLDASGLEVIFAEPLPEVGLGRAIMDRLRRASGIVPTSQEAIPPSLENLKERRSERRDDDEQKR